MSRDLRPTKRLAACTYLEEVDIQSWIESGRTCEDKVKILENIVNTGINFLLPLKKTIHLNEPAWVNRKLKHLISQRQKALAHGDPCKISRLKKSGESGKKVLPSQML